MGKTFYTGSLTEETVIESIVESKMESSSGSVTVPTKLSDLTDDLGSNPTHTHSQYLTEHQDISGKADSSALAIVATSGDYGDLNNKPTLLPNQTSGGTVVEGLFSDLPAFISGLAGKVSNGTITYKITQDETIDATTLPDFYGSVGIPVPLWNIPEVVIDGNEKTITVNSSNPYVPCVAFVPADYNMATGTLITNFNSKYQVLKIKDLTLIGTPQNTNLAVLFNSSDINLKVENCDITCTIEGSVITCEDGLNEIYTTTITSQGSTVANNHAINSVNMGSVKCYKNTYNNVGTEVYTKAGGRVQANNELYDGITFEGKFSDLPTFFESLEGKSLNGTVTYKITQDETVTTSTPFGTSDSVALPIFVPQFTISNVVIDFNEKTLTNNNSISSGATYTIVFLPYNYKGQLTDANINTQNYNSYNSLKQKITLKNGNIFATNTNSYGISLRTNINLEIQYCTITSASEFLECYYGILTASFNEFNGISSSQLTDWGCASRNLGTLISTYNIFNNSNKSIVTIRGGFARSVNDTFNSGSYRYMTLKGGFGIGYSATIKNVSNDNTSNSEKWVVNITA